MGHLTSRDAYKRQAQLVHAGRAVLGYAHEDPECPLYGKRGEMGFKASNPSLHPQKGCTALGYFRSQS